MEGSVAGGGGAKDSCPMSSTMSEDPVGLGFGVVRSGGGQESPAMAASRLSPIIDVREKLGESKTMVPCHEIKWNSNNRGKGTLAIKGSQKT